MPDLSGSPALILDLDGTVHPGTVGAEVLRELVQTGNASQEAASTALAAISGRADPSASFYATVETVYSQYAAAIDGIPHHALKNAARFAWRTCRRTVFEFAWPVVSAAAQSGYTTVIISGSPLEAVSEASLDLEISHYYGTQVEVTDGHCRARLERAPGHAGGKRGCLDELNERLTLDLGRSLAIGNSVSDIEILTAVGYPITFEADADLAALARARDWPMVDRETALRACMSVISPK
ncbi:HAD family hydrolase [Halostreptopolyspora alba]